MPMRVKLSTQFVTLDKNKTEKTFCLKGCVKGLFDLLTDNCLMTHEASDYFIIKCETMTEKYYC